jgi:hypothetical protein
MRPQLNAALFISIAAALSSTHQRIVRQRHPALLPCIAEHEQVGGDGVAEQRGREFRRVDEFGRRAVERSLHRVDDLLRGELHVRLHRERTGHRLVAVEHDARAAGANLRQRPVVVDDDDVAAEHEVGLARGDAHGVDVVRRLRDAQMARDRAAFCARPVWSSTVLPLPSRCAAMPISAPIVTTPVPPMPVTRMFHGCARSLANAGAGSVEKSTALWPFSS